MNWHQERQRLLAENVANADTPQYGRATSRRSISAARCSRRADSSACAELAKSLSSPSATGAFATERPGKYDVRPAGNAVNLEDEMMKVAANQMDHQRRSRSTAAAWAC